MINLDLDEIGPVAVYSDSDSLWTQCGTCRAVITELWVTEADLQRLVTDAVDHVCGLDPGEVPD